MKIKDKTTPILIAGLIIFAFIAGSLWTKVRNLEQNAENQGQKQGEALQQEPQGPVVLGAEDQAEIIKNAGAVKGAEDAKVTIVEFSEYQCPYCKRYVDEAYKQIMADYGDQIRYIFRDYPLPFHQHAQITAEATRCAGEQNMYWKYHDLLFEKADEWVSQTEIKDVLIGYSSQLGLNESQFRECLTSAKYTQSVKDDFALGQKMGVNGTPSFFINGRQLVGAQPYEAFQAIIEEELNQ